MLVLSRKIGEAIMVGDNIRITVVDIRGGKVRLGIAAPEDVIVDRQELHEKRRNPGDEWAIPEIWSYSWQETP
jgi:carbon storage regulator